MFSFLLVIRDENIYLFYENMLQNFRLILNVVIQFSSFIILKILFK